ncbi:MAG: pseudouridine synthase [Schleiferiaceae bacterium]|nr:pseudouridine synthase [Schleiferiaceae bacterium]MDP4773379.1 pseudouridine synthase [Schleiferiaceae bacterium]
MNPRKPRPNDAQSESEPKPAAKRPAARSPRTEFQGPRTEGSGDGSRRTSARPSARGPRTDGPSRRTGDDRGFQTGRPSRPSGDDRGFQTGRPSRPAGEDRGFRTDRPSRPDRPTGGDRGFRTDRPSRPDRMGGATKTFGPRKSFDGPRSSFPKPSFSKPSFQRPGANGPGGNGPRVNGPASVGQTPHEPWNLEGLGPKHFSGEGRLHPKYGSESSERPRASNLTPEGWRKPTGRPKFKTAEEYAPDSDHMRLNRYLAHAGVCSRREADTLIAQGLVTVNGKVVMDMGIKVGPGDDVRYAGERLKSERKMYVLLNKPKGFITTVDDERARKTVMDLVGKACRERIYPVGRLDRSTTGVLLLTNDGAMAKKLTHPSHGAKKIYQVTLDKPFSPLDAERLKQGINLEDGPAHVDKLEFPDPENPFEVGVEVHIGRNRIVRRLFGALGYEVLKLDRTDFAGLTKKNLSRGEWRLLSEKEVAFLKIQQ